MSYNAAGSLLSTSDPLGHTNSISYADKFSADGVNLDSPRAFSTFAYPTTVTDADGFSSSVWYHYDFSTQTRTQGPPPGNPGQYSNGVIQNFSYDEATRLKQATTTNTGACVHYDYGPDYTSSFASVNSVAANYWESDSYTNRFFDGLGQVFAVSSNHPGSQGGNKAQWTEYDVMGRAKRVSNPTEIDSNWNPTGDDSSGRVYTSQTYDWKGRPLVTTHETDGTTNYASYAGCGCAGGEVMTLTDEGTIVNGQAVARQQKIYSDMLGRRVKTELLNWDGTVYSTTTNTLNARDQVTNVRVIDNATGNHQDTTMTYDSYGRLQTKHMPEQQDQSGNPTSTTWAYNDDDSLSSVTDARGACATYGYNNNRQLVSSISYSAPSGITAPATVNFGYDAVGNRTSMSDESGNSTYHYDQLSRMDWEERTFSGLSGSFRLSYGYNLVGELTNVTEPSQFGASVSYQHDSVGRLMSVNGSGYTYSVFSGQMRTEVPVTTFASNIQYRAWGDMKNMDDGNGVHSHFDYNTRLLASAYTLNNFAGSPSAMTWNYDYYADGHIHHAYDVTNNLFDRAYSFDHAARLTESYSGSEARAGTTADGPYQESFSYDAWNNQLGRAGRWWQLNLPGSGVSSYTNNRRAGLGYDAAGNVVSDNLGNHVFDARGARILVTAGTVGGGQTGHSQQAGEEDASTFDGNGQLTKLALTTRTETLIGDGPQTDIEVGTATGYYLRSTVMSGYVVDEINPDGSKFKGYVYAGGERLAEHAIRPGFNTITWQHKNPMTGSWIETSASDRGAVRSEVDPMGRDVGTAAPQTINLSEPAPPPTRSPMYLENIGGQTSEAELGMQLYEDFYINKNYGGGYGPGQGVDSG